jgi:ribonuclease P protein component
MRGPAEFQELFQRGARLERPGFVLLWAGMRGRRAAGFAAGRRLGGSVIRNRARRRLREAYRRQRALLPPTGVRLCVIARAGALTTPFPELLRQMGAVLRQVGRSLEEAKPK